MDIKSEVIEIIDKDDIELKMSRGKTAEVDSKGHMINNTH